MAKCPRCKEDMPLLSKICPVCGHVEDGADEGMSPQQFVNKLEDGLRKIKDIPEPSFMKSMGQLAFIILPVITIFMLILSLITESGIFWILFVVFLALAVWAVVKKAKGNLGNDPFNRQFEAVKRDYEHNERLAKHSFGKSREISGLLDEISGEISRIDKRRKAMASKNLLTWFIILIVLFGGAVWGTYALKQMLDNPEAVAKRQTEAYTSAMNAYITTTGDPDSRDGERMDVVDKMLKGENPEAAEDFFFKYCMGQTGDQEVATKIVMHYKESSDPDAAKGFVDRCTGMRYRSAQAELKKLL